MNSEQNNDMKMEKSVSGSRRKFLQKTSVGVAIASIPAKSVWATGGGILNSISASTHASGWTGGCMYLLSHGYWKNKGAAYAQAENFQTVFGHTPIRNGAEMNPNTTINFKVSGEARSVKAGDATLFDVCWAESTLDNVSYQMAAMYLNAKYDTQFGLHFPVVNSTTGRPFATLQDYADWLWDNAIGTPGFGSALAALIEENHVGSACIS